MQVREIDEDKICFKLNGQLHHTDIPAVSYHFYKTYFWYQYGRLHRLGGPAIEFRNGYTEYWVNGIRLKQRHPILSYIETYLRAIPNLFS